MTNRYAGSRRVERRTDADQDAYAHHLVEQLRGRPLHELSVICEAVRAARPIDTRTAVAIAEAGAEAAERHPHAHARCRHCRRMFVTGVEGGSWCRYCSQICAGQEQGRNRYMRTVEDARILHVDHITIDETGQLTIDGRRPTHHPSTVVLDLSEMTDGELHLAANAVLHVLYRRFPREARLLDRTHEGAA